MGNMGHPAFKRTGLSGPMPLARQNPSSTVDYIKKITAPSRVLIFIIQDLFDCNKYYCYATRLQPEVLFTCTVSLLVM